MYMGQRFTAEPNPIHQMLYTTKI